MTAQIAEELKFEGEVHAMCTNPLNDYSALGGELPRFVSRCTALWRGYVGTWEIINDRLYRRTAKRRVASNGGRSATLRARGVS